MVFKIKESGYYYTEDDSQEWNIWKRSELVDSVCYIVAAVYKKWLTHYVQEDFIQKENK
jgi:hypothetical protein